MPDSAHRHTAACILVAAQSGHLACLPECAALRSLHPDDPGLVYSALQLQHAARHYAAQEREQRVTLECPGCHREISGPRLEHRGVACPSCGLGIPADLLPTAKTVASIPDPLDALDAALAAALGTDTLEVLTLPAAA